MTWQKFSDRARESRKLRKASPEAFVLWFAAGNWSCEHATDGHIPIDEIDDVWRPIGRNFNHRRAADECVQLGLLHVVDGYYVVNDFLEFNPSKAEIDEKKKANAERVKAYRTRKRESNANGNALRTTNVTHDVTHDVTHGVMQNVTPLRNAECNVDDDTTRVTDECNATPVPSRPDPSRNYIKEKSIKKESQPDEQLRKLIVSEFAKREQERKPDAVIALPKAPHRVAQCARWCIDMGTKHSVDSRAILDRILDNYFKSPSYWNTSPFHGFLNSYMNMWNPSSGPSVPQKVQRPALPTQDDFKRLAQEG